METTQLKKTYVTLNKDGPYQRTEEHIIMHYTSDLECCWEIEVYENGSILENYHSHWVHINNFSLNDIFYMNSQQNANEEFREGYIPTHSIQIWVMSQVLKLLKEQKQKTEGVTK